MAAEFAPARRLDEVDAAIAGAEGAERSAGAERRHGENRCRTAVERNKNVSRVTHS